MPWQRSNESKTSNDSRTSYIVELSRWGINNNGLNSVATTAGINNAFIWARDNDYNTVILPKGTYLIDKDSNVKPLSDTHYKLYDCLLIKESNAHVDYYTIFLDSIKNTTIEGVKVKGDRETHDYSSGAPHEAGYGILVRNACYNILIKNCDCYELTGDGFSVEMNFDAAGGAQHPSHFAKGDIDSSGNIDATKSNYTTVSKFFDMHNAYVQSTGYIFYAGDGEGGYGTGMNLNKTPIKVHFYKNDNTYLGYKTTRSYELIYLSTMPMGTDKVRFSYLQNFDLMNANLHYVLAAKIPHFIKFQGCKSYQNRRQGSSVMGGRFITYEDCEFFDISNPMPNSTGVSPGFGIDVEDGYHANHKITVINCNFHDNRTGDFTCVSTRGVHLERNKFTGYVRFGGSGDDYLSLNNMYYGDINGQSITSDVEADGTFCTFRNDHIFGKSLVIIGGNTLIENCVFSKAKITTSGETVKFYNCKMTFDDPAVTTPIAFGSKYLEVKDSLFDLRAGVVAFTSNNNCLKAVWDNVKIITKEISGGTICTAKDLTVIDCQFLHTGVSTTGYSSMVATESMRVENNIFKNHSFRFDGGGFFSGQDKPAIDSGYSTHLFKNNRIIWDSAVAVPVTFEARGHGVAFLCIARIDIIDNHIVVKGQTTSLGSLHNLRVFAENYVNMSNNTVVTTNDNGINTTGAITADQAYRSNASNPKPKTILISQNNKASSNSIVTITSNLNTQLEKNVLGTAPKFQVYASSIPTIGYYELGESIINSNPTPSGYVGWINTVAGYADSGSWIALTTYAAKSRVLSGGKIYEAQNFGKSSSSQPTFPAGANTTVEDKVGASTRSSSTIYSVGALVIPTTPNGFYYECITGGTSGVVEPTWSTVLNGSVVDGGVVWAAKQIIVWKNVGVPAVFKGYGLIQA